MTDQEYFHFYLYGEGASEAEAAVNFLNDMAENFPVNKNGHYDFFMRLPLTHTIDEDYETGEPIHRICMRGSSKLLEREMEFGNNVELIGLGEDNDTNRI